MFLTALRSPFLDAFLRGGFELSGGFSPVTLFAAGQQGAWYDPSDFATLSQDSAGTTPVTAVEQPIGLMRDKSGRSNHLSQATTASRPIDSARVNNLLSTNALATAPWGVNGSGVVTAGFSDPDGGTAAFRIVTTTAAGNSGTNQNGVTNGVAVESVFLRGELSGEQVQFGDASARTTVVLTTAWQRFTGAVTRTSGFFIIYSNSLAQTVYAYRPQSELGTAVTRYQRVNTATDYDSQGFPFYGRHDGIDDSMSTTTGGGSTAGYFLCQGIKPTAGAGTIRTIWSDEQANSGYRVRLNAANQLELSSGNGTPLAPPVQSAATTLATGGTGLAASTAYFYVITALNTKGESLKSNEVSVTTGLGTTNSNSLSWAAAAGATDYRVYRGLATGAQDVFYVTGNVLAFTDTGAAATAGAPPLVSETAYTAVATTAATVIGTTSLLTVWDDGTNLNAQLGSGAVASVARTVVAAGTASFTAGKRNGAAAGFFTGNLYADVYRQIAPNATERLQVQRYVASQSGVTL